MSEVNIEQKDIEGLKLSTKQSLSALSDKIYNKKLSELPLVQVKDLISLEMAFTIKQLSIHVGETRKTEVQYCTNNYTASVEVSTGDAWFYITDQLSLLETSDVTAYIERYIELKDAVYKFIKVKYEGHEQFLRDLLRAAEDKDNIQRMGRYAK